MGYNATRFSVHRTLGLWYKSVAISIRMTFTDHARGHMLCRSTAMHLPPDQYNPVVPTAPEVDM